MKETQKSPEYISFNDEKGKQQLIKIDTIEHVFFNDHSKTTVIRMKGDGYAFTKSDIVLPALQSILKEKLREL